MWPANFYYYFCDKTELFIELGTTTYREAMDVVEAFSDLGDPPTRRRIEEWVNRYFAYLDRSGAFVIRSEDDMPPDRRFRASVACSHRRTAAALGERMATVAATDPTADPRRDGTGHHGDARAQLVDGAAQRDAVDVARRGARRRYGDCFRTVS